MARHDEAWAFDERGEGLGSRSFAQALALRRDQGVRSLLVVIGGADGLAPEVRAACRRILSFGAWTWPHRLARAMLAEQLYRAVSILGASPYHRD
jgi:23S rRNA (pseudouridine1915-N3)-methyltransferase